MNLRKLTIVLGILIVVGAYIGSKKIAKKKAPPPPKKVQVKKNKKVKTELVENGAVDSKIPIYGRLIAYEKMDVVAEVSGLLLQEAPAIKEGAYYKKGSVILSLDNRELKTNILAQKSALMNQISQILPDLKLDYPESFQQWKNYLDVFNINQSLKPFPNPQTEREKYFIAAKNFSNSYYTIQAQEIRLNKYTVRAPFSGIITQGNLSPGTFVGAGQKVGTLVNNYSYELEATVSLKNLQHIKQGNQVILRSEDVDGSWEGKIKRISQSIDPNTQFVKVFIQVSGKGLREGMYLKGAIQAGSIDEAIAIPRKLLSDNNEVYLIQDSTLQLKQIELIRYAEDQAIIKGLPIGTRILSEPVIGAYEGMQINY